MKEDRYCYTLTASQVRQVRLALQQALFYQLVPSPEDIEPVLNEMNKATI